MNKISVCLMNVVHQRVESGDGLNFYWGWRATLTAIPVHARWQSLRCAGSLNIISNRNTEVREFFPEFPFSHDFYTLYIMTISCLVEDYEVVLAIR